MTTKVTVDAHAGWPVQVVVLQGEPSVAQVPHLYVVEPNTTKDFYVHSGSKILSIVELTLPTPL